MLRTSTVSYTYSLVSPLGTESYPCLRNIQGYLLGTEKVHLTLLSLMHINQSAGLTTRHSLCMYAASLAIGSLPDSARINVAQSLA